MEFTEVYVKKSDTRIALYHPKPEDIENWYTLSHDGSSLMGKMYDVDSETWIPVPKTAIQLKEEFKKERAIAVESIVVEVDGMLFDGDEISQGRMSRAIVSLDESEVIAWTLHDDSIEQVTREQLKIALRLSGAAQTELWVPQ